MDDDGGASEDVFLSPAKPPANAFLMAAAGVSAEAPLDGVGVVLSGLGVGLSGDEDDDADADAGGGPPPPPVLRSLALAIWSIKLPPPPPPPPPPRGGVFALLPVQVVPVPLLLDAAAPLLDASGADAS